MTMSERPRRRVAGLLSAPHSRPASAAHQPAVAAPEQRGRTGHHRAHRTPHRASPGPSRTAFPSCLLPRCRCGDPARSRKASECDDQHGSNFFHLPPHASDSTLRVGVSSALSLEPIAEPRSSSATALKFFFKWGVGLRETERTNEQTKRGSVATAIRAKNELERAKASASAGNETRKKKRIEKTPLAASKAAREGGEKQTTEKRAEERIQETQTRQERRGATRSQRGTTDSEQGRGGVQSMQAEAVTAATERRGVE